MNIDAISKIKPLESMFKTENQGDLNNQVESFAEILKSKIAGVKEMEVESQKAAYDLSIGARDDVDAIMIQTTKASTAIETTVQITTRAINAYKEIMQMHV